MVVEPDSPADTARTTVVPCARAVNTPAALTDATPESSALHVTGRPGSGSPDASSTTALSIVVSARPITACAAVTEIVAGMPSLRLELAPPQAANINAAEETINVVDRCHVM